MTARMLTKICFGTLAPVLLMLAPLASWLKLRALAWVDNHSEERQFGVVLAEQVLVQTPIFLFHNVGFGLTLALTVFMFFDLQVLIT